MSSSSSLSLETCFYMSTRRNHPMAIVGPVLSREQQQQNSSPTSYPGASSTAGTKSQDAQVLWNVTVHDPPAHGSVHTLENGCLLNNCRAASSKDPQMEYSKIVP
ncbi:hypothetical protein Tco_1145105 [Tanacetum coccineum]